MDGLNYSAPWHGRRFQLKMNTLWWGRFYVEDPYYLYANPADRGAVELIFSTVRAEKISDVFEHLLSLRKPADLPDFYAEMQAMAQYTYMMETALTSDPTVNRTEYKKLLWELQRTYEAALLAVFSSAKPLAAEDIKFLAYRPNLSNPNTAFFEVEGSVYEAIFDKELVLQTVTKKITVERVWSQKHVVLATSAIVDRLAGRHKR